MLSDPPHGLPQQMGASETFWDDVQRLLIRWLPLEDGGEPRVFIRDEYSSETPVRKRDAKLSEDGNELTFGSAVADGDGSTGASRVFEPATAMILKMRGVQCRVHLPTSSCSIGPSSFGVRPSHLSHILRM